MLVDLLLQFRIRVQVRGKVDLEELPFVRAC